MTYPRELLYVVEIHGLALALGNHVARDLQLEKFGWRTDTITISFTASQAKADIFGRSTARHQAKSLVLRKP